MVETRRVALTLLFVAGLGSAAFSQKSDEGARRILDIAMRSIGMALCEGNRRCSPATAEELASPPVTVAEANQIIRRGMISAAGRHCGLDWQGRNFLPMMAHWRRSMKKSERQMAVIGLVHGIVQGRAFQMFNSDKPCGAQARTNLETQLTFRP